MAKTSTLIKLAPNPENEFEDDLDGGMMDDQDFDDMDMEDDMDMDEGGAAEDMEDLAYKGRAVRGPRTKLAASDRISRIEQSIGSLAKSVNALAKVQKAMLDKDFGDDEDLDDQDPMKVEDEDDEALNLARTSKSFGRASKVAKDDAASSFGEKDSNAPGNRPYDQTDPGEDDTIIQGGPAAGPGPISKSRESFITQAQMQSMIKRSVREALQASGVSNINKSVAPGVGASSKLDKAERPVDMTRLSTDLKNRSFSEINKLRVELGDLPAGVI